MSGMSNYTALAWLNILNTLQPPSGQTLTGVWLALMTAVDTDAGTGGTEVSTSGTAYARAQVAGALALSASFTTASTTLTLASTAPAWLLALGTNGSGCNVYDATNSQQIGTVSSVSSTTVTLVAAAAHASSGSTDSIVFSAFSQSSGSAPSGITTGASIPFAQATGAGFGTVVAWELRDAVTSGNLLVWDYLGNNAWFPATVSSASPGVITAHAHGYSNGGFFVWSNELGGTAPTFSSGTFIGSIQTVAGATTDTFNVTAVNTSATGNGMVRAVTQQAIAANVTASFASGALTITSA